MLESLCGVIVGFILGFLGNIVRDNRKEQQKNAELMRSLSHEITANIYNCNNILATPSVNGYLQTWAWDKIRYSDTLYYCITMKDLELYNKLFSGYTKIANINVAIAQYMSSLDSHVRQSTELTLKVADQHLSSVKLKVVGFKDELAGLEKYLLSFLEKEKFFAPKKSKSLTTQPS